MALGWVGLGWDSASHRQGLRAAASGRYQAAIQRLSYNSLQPPNEPTPEDTVAVLTQRPHTKICHGVTLYGGKTQQHGGTQTAPNVTGRRRIYNGVPGGLPSPWPQQVYKAKTMACAIVSNMAREGDEVILDNQRAAKAAPTPRRGTIKD